MSSFVIHAAGVRKTYSDAVRSLTIFENLEFSLSEGESVGIVGSSGAGKTTLLNILGGLDAPSAGEVELCGLNLASASDRELTKLRNRNLGFVYQFHHLLPEFSAVENAAMPLIIGGTKKAVAVEKSKKLLDLVGLADRATHKPSELSGGERQRVAIARALVNEPKVVMMDEPTGNLDEQTARGIQDVMLDLQRRLKTSFVVVTHDLPLAKRLDRTLLMEEGRLVNLAESG